MNISKVVSALKLGLGLYNITLPFKDDVTQETIPTEKVIMDVLSTMTIPMYSQYVPWIREADYDVTKLKVVNRKEHIYMLPEVLTWTPIISVLDVYMPISSNRGIYGDIAPAYGVSRSAQGVITGQAYMMLAGEMRSEPTFEYKGNNKIKLYGFPRTILTFSVSCEHETSGETIPDSCYASFMELATLDMKVFLYNSLKMYKEIPTAFGNINLNIDDYQGAEADKKALLEKWDETDHLDKGLEKFM